jgi:hypothetical protein
MDHYTLWEVLKRKQEGMKLELISFREVGRDMAVSLPCNMNRWTKDIRT